MGLCTDSSPVDVYPLEGYYGGAGVMAHFPSLETEYVDAYLFNRIKVKWPFGMQQGKEI